MDMDEEHECSDAQEVFDEWILELVLAKGLTSQIRLTYYTI